MNNGKKIFILVILTLLFIFNSKSLAVPYTIKDGDSFWNLSKKFDVEIKEIFKANNISEDTILKVGQVIEIPDKSNSSDKNKYYTLHIVVKGDNLWSLSNKYDVPISEIIEANEELKEESILGIGQKISIPKIKDLIIVDETKNSNENKYGEYLNWFDTVNELIPRGSTFEIIDFYTGKSFMVKRITGSFHADVEALTIQDTEILKKIWGGFSWERRPALVHYKNRFIACSVSAMPHAGNDSVKGGIYTNWRSEGYGYGINFDYVKGNGMNGHFDVHFYGSKRHKDGKSDPAHQKCVKVSAGLIK